MLNKSATFCHPVTLFPLYIERLLESPTHSLLIIPFFKPFQLYKSKSIICSDHQRIYSFYGVLYSTFLELTNTVNRALNGTWLEPAQMRLKLEDGGFEDSVGYIVRLSQNIPGCGVSSLISQRRLTHEITSLSAEPPSCRRFFCLSHPTNHAPNLTTRRLQLHTSLPCSNH